MKITQNNSKKPTENSDFMHRSKSASIQVKHILENKNDLQSYITAFIHLYSEPHEDLDDTYRCIVLKYMKRMRKLLSEYNMCEIEDDYNIYHYVVEIDNDSVRLVLCSTSKWELQHCELHEHSFCVKATLIELKSELITVAQYASLYNVSPLTVISWIDKVRMHKAVKVNDQWLIPELHQRPKRNFYMIQYHWDSLPKNVIKKHPCLKGLSDIMIYRHSHLNLYRCSSFNYGHGDFEITEMERIALETDLMRHAVMVDNSIPMLLLD